MLRFGSTHLFTVLSLSLAFSLIGCMGKQARPAPSQLDFNRDVQPILASNCFSCHGPDPGMRKAGLRLDLEETAFKKRPGKPGPLFRGVLKQANLSGASNPQTLTI
jgi:mono/diheme cytochrome c family protein